MGKHALSNLQISFKPSDRPRKTPSRYQLRKRKIPECQASLAVAPYRLPKGCCGMPAYKDCEFPESEMPENIKKFRRLIIGHFDDEVLDFLNKLKPLFTNVLLRLPIGSVKSVKNMRTLFAYLLPMLASIRRIYCGGNGCIQLFERHFPGKLALAKELEVFDPKPASIPALLNWLNAPPNFGVLGPRLLIAQPIDNSKIILAILDAIRQQFSASAASATFVILFEISYSEEDFRAEELIIENAATKEQLAVRNACFKESKYVPGLHYVEILRHPTGANAMMREWLKKRAYFGKEREDKDYSDESDSSESSSSDEEDETDNDEDEENNMIWIDQPTIGRISKKVAAEEDKSAGIKHDGAGPSTSSAIQMNARAMDQEDDESSGEYEAGPSTSAAKKMKKK